MPRRSPIRSAPWPPRPCVPRKASSPSSRWSTRPSRRTTRSSPSCTGMRRTPPTRATSGRPTSTRGWSRSSRRSAGSSRRSAAREAAWRGRLAISTPEVWQRGSRLLSRGSPQVLIRDLDSGLIFLFRTPDVASVRTIQCGHLPTLEPGGVADGQAQELYGSVKKPHELEDLDALVGGYGLGSVLVPASEVPTRVPPARLLPDEYQLPSRSSP